MTERLIVYHFRCSDLFHRLREKGHGIDDVPGQDIMRDIRRYLFFRPDEVQRA